MNIEKRLTKLEGIATPVQCSACGPGPNEMTITYGADDSDPRTPGGGQEAPELQSCGECGRSYRHYGGDGQ